MRLVLDTNVLVSGLLRPHGAPGRLIDLLVAGRITPLYDDRILAEYREVLQRAEFGFDAKDADLLVDYVYRVGEAVAAGPLPVTLPDPDDLPFLEVAAGGAADALVTGNHRHFVPSRGSHAVRVESADQTLQRLTASSG